ncbi:MAG: hypothetical protein R3313_02915 [Candidatus Saccharimonadales bacterium]|nr:hypothetical protein [Candidatus Saccharimonadales bacterium]
MHRPLTIARRRVRSIAVALAAGMMVLGNVASVGAAALNTASISLGDPRTGETTTYTVAASGFTTATTIRCVEVDLDTQADGAGANPTSDTTSSTLDSSTLLTPASWTVDNTTDGTLRITSVGGETPAASGNIVWGSVDNGSTEGTTYYGLLTTYTDASCTGGNEVDTVTMAFIYKDGELVQLTIEPTLSFACNAVASGQDVQPNIDPGGDTTTVASGASGIDHGTTVTASQNGLSAHDLQVTTNASGGYDIFIRHTAQLTNANSDTIANHTGTNAAPTVFPAAGTEAWGYTSDDTDLVQWDAGEYAGFSTSNEQVVTNTGATAGSETTRVGHQVGIANTTPAGTYQSTIIYTIVATY